MHRLNHRTDGRTNSLPLVAVAIATVCIMAGVFLALYLTNYRYVEIRTPDGRVVFADRVVGRMGQAAEGFRAVLIGRK